MRLNLQVKLYPTKQMRTYLDSQCDYRRYCWNKGLLKAARNPNKVLRRIEPVSKTDSYS